MRNISNSTVAFRGLFLLIRYIKHMIITISEETTLQCRITDGREINKFSMWFFGELITLSKTNAIYSQSGPVGIDQSPSFVTSFTAVIINLALLWLSGILRYDRNLKAYTQLFIDWWMSSVTVHFPFWVWVFSYINRKVKWLIRSLVSSVLHNSVFGRQKWPRQSGGAVWLCRSSVLRQNPFQHTAITQLNYRHSQRVK